MSIRADDAAAVAGFVDDGQFEEGAYLIAGLNAVLPLKDITAVGSWVSLGDDAPDLNVGGYRGQWHEIEFDDGADVDPGRFLPKWLHSRKSV